MEETSTHECKNCSNEIEGNYCHFCGQRYHDHKESFGELVYEFTSDFLHFDSRFFKTVLPLLFVPGKLTKSYNAGKQRSQFHPIRLYLFSSFVYFFLFFYFTNVAEKLENETKNSPAAFSIDSLNIYSQHDSLTHTITNPIDSAGINKSKSNTIERDSLNNKKKFIAFSDSTRNYSITVTAYIDSLLQKKVTPEDYIKLQKTLSRKQKAGYLERIITLKLLKINLKGEEGKKEFVRKLLETFFHNIPKMLFFLLPVFALLLKLLYIRKKQFYFVDHAVLSLHYFSVVFLMLVLTNFILDKIFNTGFFTTIGVIWLMFYLLLAMKNIYEQNWGKTILKFFSLGILFFFAFIFTLFANMAWSAFMM